MKYIPVQLLLICLMLISVSMTGRFMAESTNKYLKDELNSTTQKLESQLKNANNEITNKTERIDQLTKDVEWWRGRYDTLSVTIKRDLDIFVKLSQNTNANIIITNIIDGNTGFIYYSGNNGTWK